MSESVGLVPNGISDAQWKAWWGNMLGSRAGISDAMQWTAFLLCCDVLSQDMAKATLRLRERLKSGTSRIVEPGGHPIADMLLLEPNHRHTWYEFSEMVGLWSAITQNGMAVVKRNIVGDPVELIPVQTTRVTQLVNPRSREVFYDVTAGTLEEEELLGAPYLVVPERDMIHVRGRMLDGQNGYSNMVAGLTTLETADSIETYRDKIFSKDGQRVGVFTRPADKGALPELAFQRLKQQFKSLMQRNYDMNDPLILEGVDFTEIGVRPDEAELSKNFDAQILQTCRLFRMPPHKVFALANVKYENLDTMEKAYIGDTMVPVCKRHEQRFSRVMLSPKDRLKYFFEYDRDELELHDTKAQTERVVRASERGIVTIDEAREAFGYNELPNKQGKARLIPVNMTVIDDTGKVIVQASSNQTDPASDSSSGDAAKKLRLVANNE